MFQIDPEDEATLAAQFAAHVLANPQIVRVYFPKRKDGAAYAYINVSVPIHRVLLGATKGLEGDHINRDGLDNRRVNLRLVTSSENKANQRRKMAKSGVRHVQKVGNRWRADTPTGTTGRRHIGYFATCDEAAEAVQRHMSSRHPE